jgi:hypothetical protein
MVTQEETMASVHRPAASLGWPVYWSAVWVGTLAAVAAALILGLIGIALGAHQLTPGQRIGRETFGIGALVFSVAGTFFAFVVGGWVAGKIAGVMRAETAMLHGAILWLVAVPILLMLAALGAAGYFGAWYGGLAGTPAWVTPSGAPVDPNAAAAARNSALGAVTALLLGLIGAVIGGWMASGEPMTFTYHRMRDRRAA